MKTKLLWGVFFLALAAALGAYFLRVGDKNRAPEPLPVYGLVPDFSLVDETGQPFSSGALQGRPWIADFIFTSCAGTCPQMTTKMARLQQKLPADVHLVSISVDPQRDSPPVLAKYAKGFGAEPGRWHFLTGEPEQIAQLVNRGFKLSYAEGSDPAEPIVHSVRFVLVDASGAIRGYYDSTEPAHVERLIKDAKALASSAAPQAGG